MTSFFVAAGRRIGRDEDDPAPGTAFGPVDSVTGDQVTLQEQSGTATLTVPDSPQDQQRR